MRNYLILIAITIALSGYSQVDKMKTNFEPDYYLNSSKIDFKKVYLNPKSIESINISKNNENGHPNGEVHIVSKKDKLSFLNLQQVLIQYAVQSGSKDPVLFIIDNNVMYDTSDIRIDKSYIKQVKVNNLGQTNYINKKSAHLTIVQIILSPEGDKKELMIRGISSKIDSLRMKNN